MSCWKAVRDPDDGAEGEGRFEGVEEGLLEVGGLDEEEGGLVEEAASLVVDVLICDFVDAVLPVAHRNASSK